MTEKIISISIPRFFTPFPLNETDKLNNQCPNSSLPISNSNFENQTTLSETTCKDSSLNQSLLPKTSNFVQHLKNLGACTISQSEILEYLYQKDESFAKEVLFVENDGGTYFLNPHKLIYMDDSFQEILRQKAWTIVGEFYEKKIKSCQEAVLYIESVDIFDSFLFDRMDWMLFWVVKPISDESVDRFFKIHQIPDKVSSLFLNHYHWNGSNNKPGWREELGDVIIPYNWEQSDEWKSKVTTIHRKYTKETI